MRPSTASFDTDCFIHHAGRGPFHFLCLPGLVPDGPETFLRQQHLLRAFGDMTTVTYPYDGFDLEQVLRRLDARVRAIAAHGQLPIVMAVSVGGGIAIELVRRAKERGEPLPLAGFILVSPFTCTDDLSPMLERFLRPILEPKPGTTSAQALERGRAFFKQLASRSAGDDSIDGWRQFLTPKGWAAWRERRIRARIEETLDGMPTHGAIDRVTALTAFRGLNGFTGVLTEAPTLILWGSRERHTLRMDGPGTGLLCRPDLAARHLPEAEIHWIYDPDGGEVPHASLIKHAHGFNPPLKRFGKRLLKQVAKAVA